MKTITRKSTLSARCRAYDDACKDAWLRLETESIIRLMRTMGVPLDELRAAELDRHAAEYAAAKLALAAEFFVPENMR